MGVCMKVGMIVVMLQMGLASGVLPLLSFHYGAGELARLKETVQKTGILCFALGTGLTAGCFLACRPVVAAFVTGGEVIDLGVSMTKAVILSGPFIGLYYLCISVMQALGKAAAPAIVSLLRQGIVYVPLMYLLDGLFQLNGLVYTQAVSDYAAIFAAVISCAVILKRARVLGAE